MILFFVGWGKEGGERVVIMVIFERIKVVFFLFCLDKGLFLGVLLCVEVWFRVFRVGADVGVIDLFCILRGF